ncbi:hypothetical protein NP493_1148g00016 [Ridgeia piscesae]|uniref:Uncharacterized protein n=1 Tax=Ridgeia piscesae TaxID=27915 RepID=A0AAD9KFE0_RIDPI|nr:hypothetical protein NP493_1148g00016 [Ridgeia piscesae]
MMSYYYMYPHNQEDHLLHAIETGNIRSVQRLMSAGISPNTVLHSELRRESATVLATAALEGQVHIMKYLLKLPNLLVNGKDSLFSRNALHWACVGGHFEVAELLLAHSVDVNSTDRDNMTPIIQAAMSGWTDIVKMLIDNGANVNQLDRMHSSALHYAAFHGRTQIVTLLIKAGCVLNHPAIFGHGTPLANLVYHADFYNCQLLIEAGYSLKNDAWIPDYHASMQNGVCSEIVDFLMHVYCNAAPLVCLCRNLVRHQVSLSGPVLEEKICKLPLPNKLIHSVRLDDVI